MVERRMREICAGLGAANGATIAVDYRHLTPSLHNGAAEAAFAAEVAAEVLGQGAVDLVPPPILGGEDFAYMLEARPGCFLFLGQGDADHRHQVHHPLYDFNDAILPLGASLFVRLVEKALPRSA
jgi:hippurate hydrolase